jgi:hypothetical protein
MPRIANFYCLAMHLMLSAVEAQHIKCNRMKDEKKENILQQRWWWSHIVKKSLKTKEN